MSLHDLIPPASEAKFCPHLGILEDAQTCTAYASEWNLCYCAKPVSAVSLEHQRKICLSPVYTRCPVFQRESAAPLPKQLRRERTVSGSKKALLAVMILLLALGLWAVWRYLPWNDFLNSQGFLALAV